MEDNCASDADSGIMCANDLQNGAFLDIPSTSSCRPNCKQDVNAFESPVDVTLQVLYSLIHGLKNAKQFKHDSNQLTLDKWVRKGAKTHSIETKLGNKPKPLSPAVTSNIVEPNVSYDTSEKLNHCVEAVSLKPIPDSQAIICDDFLVLKQNKIHSLQSNKQKCANHLARKRIKKNVTKRSPLKRRDVEISTEINSDEESKTTSVLIDERKSDTPLVGERKSPAFTSHVMNPNTHNTSGEISNVYRSITSKELPDGLNVSGSLVPNLNIIEDVIVNDVDKCLPSEVNNQKLFNHLCKKESKNSKRVTKNPNRKDLNMKICIENRSGDGGKCRNVFLKSETHTSPQIHTTKSSKVLPKKLKKINRSFANISHEKESAIQTRPGDQNKCTSLIKKDQSTTSPRLRITWDAKDASEVSSGLDMCATPREKESRIETNENGQSKSPYSLLDEKGKQMTSPQKKTPHVICNAQKNISQSESQSEDVISLNNVANENPESGVSKQKIVSHLPRKTKNNKCKFVKNMEKTSTEVNFQDHLEKKNSLLNENQDKGKESERSSFRADQNGDLYALHTAENNGIKMRSEILDAVVGNENLLNISDGVENEGRQGGDSLKTKLDSVHKSQAIKLLENKSPRKRTIPANKASSAEKTKIVKLKNSASKRDDSVNFSSAKLLKPDNNNLETPFNLLTEESSMPLCQQLHLAGFSNDNIAKINTKRLEEAAANDRVLLLIRKHQCSTSTVGPALLLLSKEQYIRTKDQFNSRKYGRIKPCFVRVEKLQQ